MVYGKRLKVAVKQRGAKGLLHGSLGDDNFPKDETFAKSERDIEYPHYTRPESFRGMNVPKVLLSGDHAKISEWRRKLSKK